MEKIDMFVFVKISHQKAPEKKNALHTINNGLVPRIFKE